ncbi:MAG: CapA family protein [Chloroflexi bacterium]|nr:CapA family protein [Chloroflexota bacterium]
MKTPSPPIVPIPRPPAAPPCAQPKTIELMTWLGVDVVELTGNHLNDWGRHNLLFTLDLYEEKGIAGYGGGRNLEEARQPLLIEHNGNKIAFVGCNPVGPWASGRKKINPGAAL